MRQPEEQISGWWRIGLGFNGSVVPYDAGGIPPRSRGQIAIGLEHETSGGELLRSNGFIAGIADGEQRRSGRLDGIKCPEAAGQGIIAALHRAAGIWLTDGADQGILPVGARAAADGDFEPVD